MSNSYTLLAQEPLTIRVQASTFRAMCAHAVRSVCELRGPQIADDVILRMAAVGVVALERSITVEAVDEKHLLAELISEAVYLADLHEEAYINVTFHTCSQTHIKAHLHGMPVVAFSDARALRVRPEDISLRDDGMHEADIRFSLASE